MGSVITAQALRDERVAAQRLVEDLRGELAGILVEQEANPPDDEHDIEGASVGYERARVTALLAEAEARLDELDEAGTRLAEGTHGRCEGCGNPIGEERLVALPATRRCIVCAVNARPVGLAGLSKPEPSMLGGSGQG